MKKLFGYGGIAASVTLIAFAIGSIAIGFAGRAEVRDSLAAEQIVASDDAGEITNGKLRPGAVIDTGGEAKLFADVMRHHMLATSEGLTYAQMGRFLDKNGNQTSDEKLAATGPGGQPVENPVRSLWVTETALTTALNTSFFAERVALFSIVMGAALLLTGIGFLVLTLGGALGLVPLPARRQVKPAVTAPVAS
jgi:hypothetical protein